MKYAALLLFIGFLSTSEGLFGISRNHKKNFGVDPFDTNPHRAGPRLLDQWVEQKLDNFDPNNKATWRMRYLENNKYYKEGGPILIFIGGEWTIASGSIEDGQHITDMAKEFGGNLFYTEHRYYGKSYPTENTTTTNLKYLSIDQALADLEYFIHYIKDIHPELKDAGVFVVGGSYSATMATWMRQKYPGVVDGAWASSAPLHAKVNFVEYKEVMGRSLELLGGKECYDRIGEAYSMMETMVRRRDVEAINTEFKLCKPLDVNNTLDVWSFFGELSDEVAGLVQTHRGENIQNACKFWLDEKNGNAFEAYAAWTRERMWNDCYEYEYDEIVKELTEVDWEAPANGAIRQWIYQTCSEFGWYQTSDSNRQPFGKSFPIDLYYNYCKDFYGAEFTKERIETNIRRINLIYGSFKPTATNVYYTHGYVDPWSAMGVSVTMNPSAPVNVIPLVAHCADLGSISSSESAELTESKLKVTKLAEEWLKL